MTLKYFFLGASISELMSDYFCMLVSQVTKLIEESTVSKSVKNAIDTDKLLDWLVENSVLSIALEGKDVC